MSFARHMAAMLLVCILKATHKAQDTELSLNSFECYSELGTRPVQPVHKVRSYF